MIAPVAVLAAVLGVGVVWGSCHCSKMKHVVPTAALHWFSSIGFPPQVFSTDVLAHLVSTDVPAHIATTDVPAPFVTTDVPVHSVSTG